LIESADWWKVLVFYFFLNIARIIMMGLLYYPINKTGEGMKFNEFVLGSWGGLRGALALVLALMVAADKEAGEGLEVK
jgi:NhaP-type Na+/H+ or K+/H+ antiporter